MPDIKTLAAARNVDLVNTFTKSLDKLAAMLSTCTPIQAAVGETLHQKKITGKLSEAAYTEGSDIPLSSYAYEDVKTYEVAIKPYRKQTTLQEVKKRGYAAAVDKSIDLDELNYLNKKFNDLSKTVSLLDRDMAALLKDALKPNLVQTLEHTPALIHGGPFANIAHGCNSVTATRMALKLGDYAVTEAGFAADLGAEKFFDIKCRLSGLRPSAVVIVATVRALKYHGGVPKAELGREDLSALEKGLPNLLHHVNTIRNTFHLPCVVAINAFPTDTAAELRLVEDKCRALGVNAVLSEVWAKGGEGGRALAQEVVRLCDQPQLAPFSFAYPDNASLAYKLNAIVGRVYGGAQAVLTPAAQKQLQRLTELGFGELPVCMAKTQYSLSDDPTLLGAPTGFTVTVRSLRVSAGAGFIVAYTGDIMTMPGLPRVPAAEKIDVDENGVITGLF